MRILIVKSSSLGDIIHTFPVIGYLKNKFPDASIDWIVEKPFAELVKAHPYINRVLTIDSKKWRRSLYKLETIDEIRAFKRAVQEHEYTIVFDLQGNLKSGLATWLARSPVKVGFAKAAVPEWPNLLFTNTRYTPPVEQNIRSDYLYLVQHHYHDEGSTVSDQVTLKITPDQETEVERLLAHPHLSGKQKIMVCPGANWPNKQISLDTLMRFLAKIHQHYPAGFILAWGTPKEKMGVEEIQKHLSDCSIIIPRLPLAVLQNMMAKVDRVIAMDSLPLHLAGTAGTATYSIFGPSLASKYKPLGVQHRAFQGNCPYGRTFDKRCPVLRTCPTGACIRAITPDLLFQDFIAI